MSGRRLAQALQGEGAFRRFKDQLHRSKPDLLPACYSLRDVRSQRRAVEWPRDEGLNSDESTERYAADHPDPALP